MRLILIVLFSLMLTSNALATDVAGVNIAPEAAISGERLQLNGYGIRKKFVFVKVYVGSLYTSKKASSTADVIALPGAKLIRMDFLHSKVDKKKIVDAFAEGFQKNSPQLVATPEARQFLALFTKDFIEGDRVDLELTATGIVTARHNSEDLGSVQSKELVQGILLIYLGEQPADADLKDGMLGKI